MKTLLKSRLKNILAKFLCRRLIVIEGTKAYISFTFDDFPKSAYMKGGKILESYELRGTFYASLGLMGRRTELGDMFEEEILEEVLNKDHELGCHTFDHLDASTANPQEFERSILKNLDALHNFFPNVQLASFSFPIGTPSIRIKKIASRYFKSCRDGGQKINYKRTDLNYLHAYFLEKAKDDLEMVREVINRNREINGWLIFATHDISDSPTPYGCTPAFFEGTVEAAARSGAEILPVGEIIEKLLRRPRGRYSLVNLLCRKLGI